MLGMESRTKLSIEMTDTFDDTPKKSEIKTPLRANGFINAGMATLACISLVINGSLSDVIINRGILSRTRTRKMFALFSGLLAATLMMCIPASRCSTSALHIILLLQAFGGGFRGKCYAALAS